MDRFGEFVANHWDLVALLALVVAWIGWLTFGGRLRGWREAEPLEAVQLMNHGDAVLLDVREEKEVNEGRVADSIHIPVGALGQRIQDLEPYRDRPVVVACRSGHRSARACSMLHKQGFPQVYNLRGGILAWEGANLPLERGKPRKGKKRRG